jgi:hypothetical protein
MITRLWHNGDSPLHYLYCNEVGRIVGETAMLGHQVKTKYSCTVYPSASESISLGMYISSESAKGMIEYYWNSRDNTIDDTSKNLSYSQEAL